MMDVLTVSLGVIIGHLVVVAGLYFGVPIVCNYLDGRRRKFIDYPVDLSSLYNSKAPLGSGKTMNSEIYDLALMAARIKNNEAREKALDYIKTMTEDANAINRCRERINNILKEETK